MLNLSFITTRSSLGFGRISDFDFAAATATA